MLIFCMRLDTIETDILWKFHQKLWHRGRVIGKRGTFLPFWGLSLCLKRPTSKTNSETYADFLHAARYHRDRHSVKVSSKIMTQSPRYRQTRHFFCRFEDFPCVWRGLPPKLTRKPMLIFCVRLDTIETDILWKFHQKLWHRGRVIGKRGTFLPF